MNHLCFADDIILFTLGKAKTLNLMMQTLKDYEDISCQMVNGDKCHFMVYPNVFDTTRDRIKKIIRFRLKHGPLTYLRCPIFMGKPRIIYFTYLVNKLFAGSQVGILSS